MPNSSSRPLLSCLTKNEVYTLYKEEMGDNPTLSRVHFLYKMWKVNFPDVYVPKIGIIVDDQGDWNGSHSYSDSYNPVVL